MDAIYDADIDPAPLAGKRIAVLGYGAQGRAQALNLRDSGADVTVGLRPGSARRARCDADGLTTASPGELASRSDVVVMLVPDPAQPTVYAECLEGAMPGGAALVFAHGFAIRYRTLVPRPDVDVLMVAPLGVGDQVRAAYEAGAGTPALLAVHQDATGNARALGLAYARAVGHGRAGVLETTFEEETETDLFAEQAVLCGGVTHLVTAAFETLTAAGYSDEVAYFCCLHELELITSLIQRRGIAGMRTSISPIAEFGDYTRGPRIINETSRAEMRRMLEEIRDGRFAAELAAEMQGATAVLAEGRSAAEAHPIEPVGRRLRAMMPWLQG